MKILKAPVCHPKLAEYEAMVMAMPELDGFLEISRSLAKSFGFLQSRVRTKFPKTCKKCNRTYESFEDFYYGTDEIPHGTVCYPTLGLEFYLHRNCRAPCESTLVIVFADRRDESDLGCQRRLHFQSCLERLMTVVPDPKEARELLLAILRRKLEAGERDLRERAV